MKLGAQRCLHQTLDIAQGPSGNIYRPHFGQGQATGRINDPLQPLRHSAPNIDAHTIAWTEDVIWPCGKIHGQSVRIANAVPEDVFAEMLQHGGALRNLQVEVVERWNVRVGIGPMANLRSIQVHVRGGRNLPLPTRHFKAGLQIEI